MTGQEWKTWLHRWTGNHPDDETFLYPNLYVPPNIVARIISELRVTEHDYQSGQGELRIWESRYRTLAQWVKDQAGHSVGCQTWNNGNDCDCGLIRLRKGLTYE